VQNKKRLVTSFFYAYAPLLLAFGFWGVCGLENQVNINIFVGAAFLLAQMDGVGVCGQDMHHKVQELGSGFSSLVSGKIKLRQLISTKQPISQQSLP